MKNSLLKLLVVTAVGLVVVGCGSSGQSKTTAPTAAPTAAPTPTATPTPTAAPTLDADKILP